MEAPFDRLLAALMFTTAGVGGVGGGGGAGGQEEGMPIFLDANFSFGKEG